MTREEAGRQAVDIKKTLEDVNHNYTATITETDNKFIVTVNMIFTEVEIEVEYIPNKTNQIVQAAGKIAEKEVRAPKCVRDGLVKVQSNREFIEDIERQLKERGIFSERITGKQSGNLLGWYINAEDLEKPLFCESVKNKIYVAGIDDYNLDNPSKIGFCWVEKREQEALEDFKKSERSIVERMKPVQNELNKEIRQIIEDIRNGVPTPIDPTKGQKLDDSKLPLAIVIQRQFPEALKAVAKCSKYGHDKYKDTDANWDNLHYVDNGVERYSNAMMRHYLAAGMNLDKEDPETNLPHLHHALWNMLAMVELIERQEKDPDVINKNKTND